MSDGNELHVKEFVEQVGLLEDQYAVALSDIGDSTFTVWYKGDSYEVNAPVSD